MEVEKKRKRTTTLRAKILPIELNNDEELEAFKLMIEYLYKAELYLEDNKMLKVMEIADKFTVVALREACAASLGNNIRDTNVLMLLELVGRFGAYQLKRKAGADFVATNNRQHQPNCLHLVQAIGLVLAIICCHLLYCC